MIVLNRSIFLWNQGMVASGLCFVGMSWCVKQKGPVFTAAFNPSVQIFVAIFDFSILHAQIYLGRFFALDLYQYYSFPMFHFPNILCWKLTVFLDLSWLYWPVCLLVGQSNKWDRPTCAEPASANPGNWGLEWKVTTLTIKQSNSTGKG